MKKSLLMLCAGAMLATTNAQARVAGNSFGALELGVGYAGVSAKVKNTALITVKGAATNATLEGTASNHGYGLFAGYDFYLTDHWGVAPTYHFNQTLTAHKGDKGGGFDGEVQFEDVSAISLKIKYYSKGGYLLYLGPQFAKGTTKYTYKYDGQKKVVKKDESGTAVLLGMQSYLGQHLFFDVNLGLGASKVPTATSLSLGFGF